MSLILGTHGFLYGAVGADKPKLPEGWSYIEKAGHWLLAESPERKQFCVTAAGLLYPWVRAEDGKFFADLNNPIQV